MTNYIKIFLSIIVWTAIDAFPQIDTTRKEFYPLHVGDIWQYKNETFQLLTARIRSDTVIDNIKYYVFETVGLKTSGGITRVDSLIRVEIYGGSSKGEPCIIYKLAEPDSTIWEICFNPGGFLGTPLIRFNNIFEANIFGQRREIMHFDFGGTLEGEEWTYGAMLAKGIGVVEERYYEGGYSILQGAIIDGVQYGNIVSIGNFSETIPKEITLYQNYPNPFNPSTKIRYEISKTTYVKLEVINILGESIEILAEQIKHPGSYEVEFNASSLSSGVYIAVLRTPGHVSTRTMMLIK
jgi:hypothetical protein